MFEHSHIYTSTDARWDARGSRSQVGDKVQGEAVIGLDRRIHHEVCGEAGGGDFITQLLIEVRGRC
jgi:hypothetical protein